MRKSLILSLALTLSAGLWANQITYTATEALFVEGDAFTPSVDNQTFVSGVGYINFFSGDVTEIKEWAFKNCSKMTSITIPSSVTSIGNGAFSGCTSLTAVTFESSACQYAIGENAFSNVGSQSTPITLVLPEDWNYANAPTNNTTPWYGGHFNSNLYSEDEATDKQAAIDTLTAIVSDYSTSVYLQSLLAEEVAKINSAVNRTQVNERKQVAIDRLTFVVNNYVAGRTDGFAAAKAELPTDPEGTAGHTVTIIKGDKTLILINPDKVTYGKQE